MEKKNLAPNQKQQTTELLKHLERISCFKKAEVGNFDKTCKIKLQSYSALLALL